MERGLEQLFILAVIIFAGLVELIVRRQRGKAGKDRPPVEAGVAEVTEVADVADLADVEDALDLVEADDAELSGRGPVAPQLPPPPAAMPSPRRSPPPLRPRRRQRVRRWLTHPLDARSGIVLMAILGPCRGLQAPGSDT
jgi:type IV secretory pathway VirB10-like protein